LLRTVPVPGTGTVTRQNFFTPYKWDKKTVTFVE
jgi:hypothetical protein